MAYQDHNPTSTAMNMNNAITDARDLATARPHRSEHLIVVWVMEFESASTYTLRQYIQKTLLRHIREARDKVVVDKASESL